MLEQTTPLDMGRGGNANHNQSTDSGRIYFYINRRLRDRYRQLLRVRTKKAQKMQKMRVCPTLWVWVIFFRKQDFKICLPLGFCNG
jgi:hypothetical protein